MKRQILVGSTSNIVELFVQDSSSTTGAGKTGLSNGSSGLTCYYKRGTSSSVQIVTLANIDPLGTYVDSGFREIHATLMPGVYEFHPPNAAFQTGTRMVAFLMKGASNMAPIPFDFELTQVDNQDGVRFGLTALPNAAAQAAGGLYTRGTGAGQINQPANGQIDAVPVGDFSVTMKNSLQIATIANVSNLIANADKTGYSVTGDFSSVMKNSLSIATLDNVLKLNNAATVTVGTNNDKTGYSLNTADDFTVVMKNSLMLATIANVTNLINPVSSALSGDFTATMKNSLMIATIANVTNLINPVSVNLGSIPSLVWNATLASYPNTGSTGKGLTAASAGGDPWETAVPGAYGSGTAGYQIGNVSTDVAGAQQVTIKVNDMAADPIPDAEVRILNSGQTATIKTKTTDANGQVVTSLDAATYKVRLTKAMVNFEVPETLVVSGTTTHTYTGSSISPSQPTAGLQTCYFIPDDLNLTYDSSVVVTASITTTNIFVGSAIVAGQSVKAVNKSNRFELYLLKSNIYRIIGTQNGVTFLDKTITVTTDDSKDLSTYA